MKILPKQKYTFFKPVRNPDTLLLSFKAEQTTNISPGGRRVKDFVPRPFNGHRPFDLQKKGRVPLLSPMPSSRARRGDPEPPLQSRAVLDYFVTPRLVRTSGATIANRDQPMLIQLI